MSAVGNRSNGIALQGTQNIESGGILAGAGNTITNNGAAGVAIFEAVFPALSSTGNSILGNSIYHNGLLSPLTTTGIDLVASNAYPLLDGVTPNDLGDGEFSCRYGRRCDPYGPHAGDEDCRCR